MPILYVHYACWSIDCFLDRLQDAIVSQDVSSTVLLDALSSLGLLRSTFFAYNRSIAEVRSDHPLLSYLRNLLSLKSLRSLTLRFYLRSNLAIVHII